MIRTTLQKLESKLDSCIRFVESSSGNRVYVKNNGGGCYSSVGYQGQPTQDLSLQVLIALLVLNIFYSYCYNGCCCRLVGACMQES